MILHDYAGSFIISCHQQTSRGSQRSATIGIFGTTMHENEVFFSRCFPLEGGGVAYGGRGSGSDREGFWLGEFSYKVRFVTGRT